MASQGKIRVYKRVGKKKTTYTYLLEAGRDVNGKRRRVTKSGFKTAKEARTAALPVLNKLLLGKNIVESNITFNEYTDKWLEEHSIELKRSSLHMTKSRLNIIKKYLGNLKLKDITLYIYQQFLNDYATKVSRKTVIEKDILAKMIFKQAVKYNIILSDPTIGSKIPKTPEKIIDVNSLYLTKEELHTMTDFVCNYKSPNSGYFYYFLMLLIYTGFRVGEAIALTWDNINFQEKYIYINSTMYFINQTHYERQNTPKTKSSVRKVFINNSLIKLLKEWKTKQLEIRMKRATMNKRDSEDYVFTRYSAKVKKEVPVSYYIIYMKFNTINKAGIINKKIHPHLIRHTHASLMAEAGIALETIQDRLGHADDKTTKTIYLHITEKQKENAALIFENYLAK